MNRNDAILKTERENNNINRVSEKGRTLLSPLTYA